MALKIYRPTSPGRRGMSGYAFDEITKDKPEKEQPLAAKEFALYRAGVYDMAAIKALPWADYRPFGL